MPMKQTNSLCLSKSNGSLFFPNHFTNSHQTKLNEADMLVLCSWLLAVVLARSLT